jgi:hypothetical protein
VIVLGQSQPYKQELRRWILELCNYFLCSLISSLLEILALATLSSC